MLICFARDRVCVISIVCHFNCGSGGVELTVHVCHMCGL